MTDGAAASNASFKRDTFHGGHDRLAEHGVKVAVLEDGVCIALIRDFIVSRPELWHEDIGE